MLNICFVKKSKLCWECLCKTLYILNFYLFTFFVKEFIYFTWNELSTSIHRIW